MKFIIHAIEPALQALERGRERGKLIGRARNAWGEGEGSACSQPIVYLVFLVRRRTKNRHWSVFNYASIIA